MANETLNGTLPSSTRQEQLTGADGSLFEGFFGRTSAEDLLKIDRDQGMTTLVQDGVIKVIQGWIDFKQVKSVAIK